MVHKEPLDVYGHPSPQPSPIYFSFPLATHWALQVDLDNKTIQFLQVSSRTMDKEFWGPGYLEWSLEERGPKILMDIVPLPRKTLYFMEKGF